MLCPEAFADADAVGEPSEVVVGELVGCYDVVEDGGGDVVEFHVVAVHLVEEVFFFGSDEAVAFAPQLDVEEAYGVEDAAAVAGVAASGVAVARELPFAFAVVEASGDELAGVVRHPAGFFGFVDGQYGAAGGDGLRVAGEEGGVAFEVLRVDGGVVVDVGQQVAVGFTDAAVAGMGEPLAGLDTVVEGDVGVVGSEPSALASGVVGAVVVDQYDFVLVVREAVLRYAAEHVVDVFLPVVGAEDDGEHGGNVGVCFKGLKGFKVLKF